MSLGGEDKKRTLDPESVRQDWEARGFSCGVWTDPPGREWLDYVHSTDELFMVLEGSVELEVRGQAHRPRAGEEILIPARARHSVRNVGSTASRWLYGYKRAAS